MLDKFLFEKKDFLWLIEKLLPPNNKMHGCEVPIIDLAVFQKSKKVKLICKTDANGVFTIVK